MPLLGEGRQEAAADSRDRELEDEQRDRDREDAIGERVESVERQDIGRVATCVRPSSIARRSGRSRPHRRVDRAPSTGMVPGCLTGTGSSAPPVHER